MTTRHRWLAQSFRDARHAARALRRQPVLVLAAVASLALGIGLNTAVFALTNAVMFKPLPGANGGRLVQLFVARSGEPYLPASYPDYRALRDRVRPLDALATYAMLPATVRVGDTPRAMILCAVSGSFFPMLALRAARGRLLLPDDNSAPAGSPVALISHHYWRKQWSADPRVVGRTVLIDRIPVVIVGVAPRGFAGPMPGASFDIYVPAMLRGTLSDHGSNRRDLERGAYWGWMVGRLRRGSSIEQARAGVALAAATLARRHPRKDSALAVHVFPDRGMRPDLQRHATPFLALVSAIVAIVMLTACANVAGLLLARVASREREIAIRLSLGATRASIARQVVLESLLLAALGGVAGALVALWATHGLAVLLRSPVDMGLRVQYDFGFDGRVTAFAAAVSLACGLLFGLIAAAEAVRRPDRSRPLRAPAATARRRSGFGTAIVVVQAALAVSLLATAAVLVRTMERSLHAPTGFRPGGVVVASVAPQGLGYPAARKHAFENALLRRFRASPAIASAGFGSGEVLDPTSRTAVVALPGHAATGRGPAQHVPFSAVTPGTLELLGVALLRGRTFRDADRAGATPVAIVDESLARRMWPAGDAVGRQLLVDGKPVRVIGLVRDAAYAGSAAAHAPYLFLSFAQQRASVWSVTIYARPRPGDARDVIATIRRAVRREDPDLPVTDAGALTGETRVFMNQTHIFEVLAGIAASLALVLATTGVYALILHSVAERTREIAVRVALGARAAEVRGVVVGGAARLAALGAIIGLPAGAAAVRLMRGRITGVEGMDAGSLLAAALIIVVVAVGASWGPARRAARVDPMTVLRSE